jgi:hypothetical protein
MFRDSTKGKAAKMKIGSWLNLSFSVLLLAPGLVASAAGMAKAQEVAWQRIVGLQVAGDLVGSGSGTVSGAVPWTTTNGNAEADLNNGNLRFQVEGLVLAVGSAGALTGLPIGTTAGVTEVKGTLVCGVNGSAGGNSILIDTPAVPLNALGNASFAGNVGSLPAACDTVSNDAFLIRIVDPVAFADAWIAFGAVPVTENHHKFGNPMMQK